MLPVSWLRMRARLKGQTVYPRDLHFAGQSRSGVHDDLTTSDILGLIGRDSWAERVSALSTMDFGIYNKGILAGWGIDMRDPTADRRLIQLCLSFPDEVFLRDGTNRALARGMLRRRLPADVVFERQRGYQGADWRRAFLHARSSLHTEISRARHSVQAQDVLALEDLERVLAGLSDDESPDQPDEIQLRRGVLRSAAAAHFIRVSTNANY